MHHALRPLPARDTRGKDRGERKANKSAPPLPNSLLHRMEERERSKSLMWPCNSDGTPTSQSRLFHPRSAEHLRRQLLLQLPVLPYAGGIRVRQSREPVIGRVEWLSLRLLL